MIFLLRAIVLDIHNYFIWSMMYLLDKRIDDEIYFVGELFFCIQGDHFIFFLESTVFLIQRRCTTYNGFQKIRSTYYAVTKST